jgi:hypothetical protein
MSNEYAKYFKQVFASPFFEQIHNYAYGTEPLIIFCSKDWDFVPTSLS